MMFHIRYDNKTINLVYFSNNLEDKKTKYLNTTKSNEGKTACNKYVIF